MHEQPAYIFDLSIVQQLARGGGGCARKATNNRVATDSCNLRPFRAEGGVGVRERELASENVGGSCKEAVGVEAVTVAGET